MLSLGHVFKEGCVLCLWVIGDGLQFMKFVLLGKFQ
jgi:hypothetical protein